MSTYEKEIYASTIPLTKEEVLNVLEHTYNWGKELSTEIPGLWYRSTGNREYIYYCLESPVLVLDLNNFGLRIKESKDRSNDPSNDLRCYGYLEFIPIAKGISSPVQIKLISYQEKLDVWWIKLAQNIIDRVRRKFPDFIPDLVPTNQSRISSESNGNIPSTASSEQDELFEDEKYLLGNNPKYGTNGDVTANEIRNFIKRYHRAHDNFGYSIPKFYNIALASPERFTLNTFRKWLKDDRFNPKS
jgi:hypothetical protein